MSDVTAETWIDVERTVNLRISAKDLALFLTTPACVKGIDKAGLAQIESADGDAIHLSFTTVTTPPKPAPAIVDMGAPELPGAS